jgi:hypothetical protein
MATLIHLILRLMTTVQHVGHVNDGQDGVTWRAALRVSLPELL